MMNPRFGKSLGSVSSAFAVFAMLSLVLFWAAAAIAFTNREAGIAATFFGWGLGCFFSLWFSAACGKVLADIHGYFVRTESAAIQVKRTEQSSKAVPIQPPPADARPSRTPPANSEDAWQQALNADPVVKRKN